MSTAFAKHLRREAAINGVMNALFNGAIAAWLLKGKGVLPMWGGQGFAIDMIATAFALVFIVSCIVIPLTQHKLRRGKLPQPHWQPHELAARLSDVAPRALALRALWLGLFASAVVAPLSLLLLCLVGVQQLTAMDYALFKGLWAGALAALMVPPMIWLGTAGNRDGEPVQS